MRTNLAIRPILQAALAETWLRLLYMSRYPGELIMEILSPIFFAAMPIFLSQAVLGNNVATNFEANTGTANYVLYLLVGANAFTIVTRAFKDIARWLRYEQETGTLEAIYLTPTSALTLASGVGVYSAIRGMGTSIIAYLLGCLLFRVNPFQGNIMLAFLFILVGLTPLYAIAFLFGSLVLKMKKSEAILGLIEWGACFLMGVYYPLTMLPPLARALALLFPPTWLINGVRSALLGAGFFFERWYYDMAVLCLFLIFTPLFTLWVFRRVENNIRHNEGIGQF